MNSRTFIAAFLLSLSTMGSSCINDGVTVSVNLNPIVGRYRLGTMTSFAGIAVVQLDSLIPPDYKNKIRQGRIYDFKVHVEGEYSGAVSGVVAIKVGDGSIKEILRFPQQGTVDWSVFHTPQSLLNKSPYLIPLADGISELLGALTTSPLPVIFLSTAGMLSVAPVPDNLYVVIELYLQADAELK